jgi:hypothetical protein
MKRNELDQALAACRRAAVPAVPANLTQNVWREIRRRQAVPASSFVLDGFLDWFRAGGISLAGATLALAMLTSVGMTFLSSRPNHKQQMREALGLNVFSLQAYPLSRLAERTHE